MNSILLTFKIMKNMNRLRNLNITDSQRQQSRRYLHRVLSPICVSYDPEYQRSRYAIEMKEKHIDNFYKSVNSKNTQSKHPSPLPPGLRGRQIGLFYAQRSRQKSKNTNDVFLDMFAVPNLQQIFDESDLPTDVNASSINPTFAYNAASDYSIFKHNPHLSDHYTDHELKSKYLQNQKSLAYDEFHKQLPSYKLKEQIIDWIDRNQAIIITGETGCGKSTQIPQYILYDWIVNREKGTNCKILCTQPRRICTTSLASRVSCEWGDSSAVGYHIRFEPRLPRSVGSLTFCTTGVALKYIENDLLLSRYSHIIVDEVHERALETEILLIHLKELMEERKDLKIILMSASVQAEKFSEWLGNVPILDIPSRRYDVRSYFLEDIVDELRPRWLLDSFKTRKQNNNLIPEKQSYGISRYGSEIIRLVANSEKVSCELISETIKWIKHHHNSSIRSILVFLPGMSDIGKCSRLLSKEQMDLHIIPLHSMLPQNVQFSAFDPPPTGKVKIILATNIAESSITINDVDAVIDCGYSKQEGYDISIGTRLLNQALITKANVCQRKGRAGRVRDGICVHLYSKETFENKMEDFPLSGLLNARLDQVILQVKASGYTGEIRSFLSKAVDKPSDDLINSSVNFLCDISAIDRPNDERLTPCGYLLSQLPCDAQIAKMVILGALFHCINPIVTIAAFISSPDPFFILPGEEQQVDKKRKKFMLNDFGPAAYSDHLLYLSIFEEWSELRSKSQHLQFCDENFLSDSKLNNIRRARSQLWDLIMNLKFFDFKRHNYNLFADRLDLISFILSVSLYPNIAIPKSLEHSKRPMMMKTATNRSVTIASRSLCSKMKLSELPSLYFCYFEKVKNSNGTLIYDLSPINPLSLLFCAKNFEQKTNFSKMVDPDSRELYLLDDWIEMKIRPLDLQKAILLRRTFDCVVEEVIKNPQCIDINADTNISRSIKTIVSSLCSY
ncbi:hypothetical protein GJ496_011046 [Pomphorhynchus laevis]|nr:hypothetical protein GJ496_011046 [Pomphorhynchus laevis]